MLWLAGVFLTIAWGALAFGGNYSWAHAPLLIANPVLGLTALWSGRRGSRTRTWFLVCLGFVVVGVVVQLVPLPPSWLNALSPHAVDILSQRDLSFSLNASTNHPLSIDPVRTRLGLTFLTGLGLLLLGTARVVNRKTANHLAGGIVTFGVALAIIGIVQRATFNGKIYGFWELVQGGSPFGPFVNKNHFAGWMLMALPVGIGYLLALVAHGMKDRKPGFRNLVLWFSTEQANRALLTGFGVLVMALSLVLTMSRSGISGLMLALVLAGSVVARHESGGSRRALAIGYFLFLAVTVVSWVGIDQIVARFAEMDPTSINERPAIWADTVRIVKDFWLTGTGLNTYGVSTLFYQTAIPDKHLQEAHNDYLQLAAEGGLLLSIPITLSIIAFALEVRRRLREDVGSIWWIRMGAVIGLVAIALQSLVEFSLQMPGNAVLFAVISGLAIHDGRRL